MSEQSFARLDDLRLDGARPEPETYCLSRIAGPQGDTVFLAAGRYAGKRGGIEDGAFYAVIHRRFGVWTHLYRVVPADAIHGFIIYLEKAFDGEAVASARDCLRKLSPA